MSLANYTDRIQSAFGRALRERRNALGLTQEELGHRAGIDRVYVSELERGLKCPTLITVAKVAIVLELVPSQLLRAAEELIDRALR